MSDTVCLVIIQTSVDICRHMCVHQHVKGQNSPPCLAHLCWHHCRRSAKWDGVTTLRHTVLLGKIHVSLSRLRTVMSTILHSPGICFFCGSILNMTHPDVYSLSGGGYFVTTWPWPIINTLSGVVRTYKAEMICLGMPKCLATAYWVAPVCKLLVTLLRWADVNPDVIALTTLPLCGLIHCWCGFLCPT